jgi:hypothetical protein
MTSELQIALIRFKDLLAEAGLDRVLACDTENERPQVAERFQALARLFGESQEVERRDLEDCVPREVVGALETLGLVTSAGGRIAPA